MILKEGKVFNSTFYRYINDCNQILSFLFSLAFLLEPSSSPLITDSNIVKDEAGDDNEDGASTGELPQVIRSPIYWSLSELFLTSNLSF